MSSHRISVSSPASGTLVNRPPTSTTPVTAGPIPQQPTQGRHHFTHRQTVPAATWTITHGLGCRPPVALFLQSSPAEEVFASLSYPDENTIVVEFPTAEAGSAYI